MPIELAHRYLRCLMHINKLVLKSYKRLMLSNIQLFEWTPQHNMMIMLGSNGSGKSSIIDELTPLPSHQDNFAKGGVKEIYLTHKGREYALVSYYEKEKGTGRHSFIVDDKELNSGGTMLSQKELVFEHFGLTREIHDVLSGTTRFTTMSTAKRREWLTMLSPVDLGFAFHLFDKAKTNKRDQVALIRHMTKRMTNENVDLPDDEEMKRHRRTIDELTARLNNLFQSRRPEIKRSFQSNESAVRMLMELVQRGKTVLNQYPVLMGDSQSNSQEMFQTRVSELSQSIANHENMLNHFMHELHEVQQHEPAKDQVMSKEEMDALEDELNVLRAEYDRLQGSINAKRASVCFPLVAFDVSGDPHGKLDTLLDRWLSLIQSFPENEDNRFSTQTATEHQDKLKQLKAYGLKVESDRHLMRQRLARIRGCETVECPKCTHVFQPGVDLNEASHLEAELKKTDDVQERLDKRQKELETYMEEFQHYSSFVFQFRGLAQDYAIFKPLWDYCAEHRVMFSTPRQFMTDAIGWGDLMRLWIDEQLLKEKIDRLQHKLDQARAYDQDAIGFMAGKRKQLEERIEGLTHLSLDEKRYLREYSAAGNKIISLEASINQLISEFVQFYESLGTQMHYLQQQGIEAEIQHLQLQMADARRHLHQLELREHTLKEIEREHLKATELNHDWNVLVKALSPTDGMIGRYLMGFMQAMVGLMNAVIEEVWTYPLKVLPSRIDKEGLDYLFPLDVNDGAVSPPDIARGSTGQQEIVNFAFKLLAMKFLKLEGYPLLLDELGSSFDEAHRFNLVPFLLQLIELNQHSQVFYISHFAFTHGAFNHAEFLVMDPTNVTVPREYNQHVVIA